MTWAGGRAHGTTALLPKTPERMQKHASVQALRTALLLLLAALEGSPQTLKQRQSMRSVLRPFFRLLPAPCWVTYTAVMATIMHAINALKGTLPTLRTCTTET